MSTPKPRFILSPEARADLKDLPRYTARQWGRGQRDLYKRDLYRDLEDLARFPLLGRARPEYGEQTRSYVIGMHVVIYEPAAPNVLIARIIHQSRDLARRSACSASRPPAASTPLKRRPTVGKRWIPRLVATRSRRR